MTRRPNHTEGIETLATVQVYSPCNQRDSFAVAEGLRKLAARIERGGAMGGWFRVTRPVLGRVVCVETEETA